MSLNKELNSEVDEGVTEKPPYAYTMLSENLGQDLTPTIEPETYKQIGPVGLETIKHLKPEPTQPSSWGETVGAFYRHNDPLFNYAKYTSNAFHTLSDLHEQNRADFDPMPLLPNYPPSMWRDLATASTKGEFYRKATSMEIDEQDMQTMDKARWYTNLTAGIAGSATNLFYVLGGGSIAGTTILKGGLQGLVEGAVTGIASEMATEGVLLGTQEKRELSESLWNIGIAGITGSVFGGLGGSIRAAKYPIYKKMIESQLNGETVKFGIEGNAITHFNVYDKSTGALQRKINLEGEQLLGYNSKGKYSAASPFLWFAGDVTQNPIIKVLRGKSPYAAKFINLWLENNMDVIGSAVHGSNSPISVQRKIERWNAYTAQGNQTVFDGYMEYLGNEPGMSIKNIMAKNFKPPAGFMSYEKWCEQLIYPIVTGIPDANPVVQKYSMKIANEQFGRVQQGLVDVKKLPPDLELSTAAGHVTRIPNVPKLEAYPVEAKKFLYDSYAETRQHVLDANSGLRNLEAEVKQLKESLQSVKSEKSRASIVKQLESKEAAHLKEKNRLDAWMESGAWKDIDIAMVVNGAKGLEFRAWKSDLDLKLTADTTYNRWVGLDEDDFAQQILGGASTSSGEGFLKEREVMIHDKKLYESGWMLADIRQNIAAMNSRGGRVIEIEKFFQENGIAMEGKTHTKALAHHISNDFMLEAEKLAAHYTELKIGKSGKELDKIIKKESKAQQALIENQRSVQATIADSYIRIARITPNKYKKLTRAAKLSNDWANGSQLGGLSTLMFSDIISPMFRNGLSWFAQGPGTFAANLIKGSGGDNIKLKEQAADLNLGNDFTRAMLAQKFSPMDPNINLPTTKFEQIVAKSPTAMGILSGATYLNDIGQKWGVTSTASHANRLMRRLIDGTISNNDAIWLRNIGLGDIAIAKDLIGYIDLHGEKMPMGAAYLNWNNWDKNLTDVGEIRKAQMARNHIQDAITKNVKSTSFSGVNPASYPSGLPINPIMSAIIPYMGWIFDAQAKYMIPMVQRFDPNRVIGFVAIASMNSLSDVLRDLAMGREPNLDSGVLLKKGILGSGFLGVAGDLFNRANTYGDIIPELKVDRYERKGIEAFVPLSNLFKTASQVTGMVLNNDYNRKELKDAINTLPLVRAITLRKAVDELINSWDISERKTRGNGSSGKD